MEEELTDGVCLYVNQPNKAASWIDEKQTGLDAVSER